jgi:hypothetical protein
MEGWEMKLEVGSTIYSRKGVPVVITGETKVNWVVGGNKKWDQEKIKKSTMRNGNSGGDWIEFFVDLQDALDCRFVAANAYKIGSAVQGCKDGKVLRKIAELIGYKEGDK